MATRDYYDVLNVAPTATAMEIRAAYRALVKRWHPDCNRHPRATARLQEINEAYDCLKDPSRRAVYDFDRRKRRERTEQARREPPKGEQPKREPPPEPPKPPRAFRWTARRMAAAWSAAGLILLALWTQWPEPHRSPAPPVQTAAAAPVNVPSVTPAPVTVAAPAVTPAPAAETESQAESRRAQDARLGKLEGELIRQRDEQSGQAATLRAEIAALRSKIDRLEDRGYERRLRESFATAFAVPATADPCTSPLLRGNTCSRMKVSDEFITFTVGGADSEDDEFARQHVEIVISPILWELNIVPSPGTGGRKPFERMDPALRATALRILGRIGFAAEMLNTCERQGWGRFERGLGIFNCREWPGKGGRAPFFHFHMQLTSFAR